MRTAYLLERVHVQIFTFIQMIFVYETGRQFPIISVADEGLGDMCFPAGIHYLFILPFEKVCIYGDIKT